MKHSRILAFSLVLTLANFGAFSQQVAKPVYMNSDAPIADRVKDLLNRMTLEEKVAQLESFTNKPVVPGMHLETAVEGDHLNDSILKKYFANGMGTYAFMDEFSGMSGDVLSGAQHRNLLQSWVLKNTRLGVPIMFHGEALHGAMVRRLHRTTILALITWQSLSRVLNVNNTANQGWRSDLAQYLRHCGLEIFSGFSRWHAPEGELIQIRDWSMRTAYRRLQFQSAFKPQSVRPATHEEFASAVASAISSVHHLYREVDRLITGIKDRLVEEPDSLSFLAGIFSKAGPSQTRRVIRNEFGALFAPKTGEDDDGDEDEGEVEDDGDEPEEELNHKPRKGTPAQIGAKEALLAVRIVLVDPQKRDSFEPRVQYAVMNRWSVGIKPWDSKEVFEVRKSVLKRVPRALGGPDLTKGSKLTTKATMNSTPGAKRTDGRQLCCHLPVGVESILLYDLDSADALDELVKKMKLMWSSAQSL